MADASAALSEAAHFADVTWDEDTRFEIGLGQATLTLNMALRGATKMYEQQSMLEFPLARLRGEQTRCIEQLSTSVELRAAHVCGNDMSVQQHRLVFGGDAPATRRLQSGDAVLDLHDAMPALLGKMTPTELGDALQVVLERKKSRETDALDENLWLTLREIILRFGAFGIDADGFAELCLSYLCWNQVSTDWLLTHMQLADIYRRIDPVVGQEWEAVTSGRTPTAKHSSATGKKRKQPTVGSFFVKLGTK